MIGTAIVVIVEVEIRVELRCEDLEGCGAIGEAIGSAVVVTMEVEVTVRIELE